MADKDLLVVISEMLHKQDEHTELIKETNNTLKEFMGVSIKQFEQKQVFNEKFLKKLEAQQEFNDHFLNRLDKLLNMEDRIKRLESAVFK